MNYNLPTEAERNEAQKLHSLGYIPISNKFLLAAPAPAVNVAEALAHAYTKGELEDLWASQLYPKGDKRRGREAHFQQQLAHWNRFDLNTQREHYARVFGEHKTLTKGVYKALKDLCGPFNRGT